MSDPRSTYRIQLNPGFKFKDVASIAGYLAELGITHVYCSPYLHSSRGSTHGYDVTDHSRLDAELGGEEAFETMVAALREHGMGHIADIVPNHVALDGRRNTRWWAVLRDGRDSEFAHYFDIDWERYDGKVLAPVLGDELDVVLQKGEIEIVDGDEPVVRYHEHRFPVAPGTYEAGVPVEEVLNHQNYLLAYWRKAARGLNYRRFFDIDTLAAVQIDEPGVFEETHGLTLELIGAGKLDGLRIDHIDGLRDPRGYLRQLHEASGGVYTVVEKILEPGEALPREWPVQGTTGYDFLNLVNGLFIDPATEDAFSGIYADFTGEDTDLDEVTRAKKMLIMRQVMVSDINRIVREAELVFEHKGWAFDEDEMRVVIGETIAAFDVYRTYISPEGEVGPEDRKIITEAIERARRHASHIPAENLDRLRSILLLETGGDDALDLVLRFQQTTGPIMAKGVEDTVFYNYNRFVALNEVGGSPGHFGTTPATFHEAASRARSGWPLSMLALSTHDTKRSEDVRARLAVLTHDPEGWRSAVTRWRAIAEPYRSGEWPDRNAEYLLYQVLVGAWPLSEERAVAYMQKASKEAKRYTSWIDPSEGYDVALESFVRGLLNDEGFCGDLAAFVQPLIEPGRVNSLAQTLIKLTYPGVPDTYQGTETWDLSLVDPDNRRPVDFPARRELLERALSSPAAELWAAPDDGASKMLVTATVLRLRKERPGLLGPGAPYEPLEVSGAHGDRVVGFLRGPGLAIIVPRLAPPGATLDATVTLPRGRWLNLFTEAELPGGVTEAAELFAEFPVALLQQD